MQTLGEMTAKKVLLLPLHKAVNSNMRAHLQSPLLCAKLGWPRELKAGAGRLEMTCGYVMISK
jgi:hypothetical protein